MRGISSLLALLGLFHYAQASDSTDCSLSTIAPSKNLTWCPCEDGYFCARLDVPLDYQNPELGRASVPLIKYPASENSTFGPYQGMVLLNPGGPGSSGVDAALEDTPNTLPPLIGTNWDIVGFDPRGIGLSEPVLNCSAKTSAQDATTKSRSGTSSRSGTKGSDGFYEKFIPWMRYGAELGSDCATNAGGELDAGRHMSTAINARDMLSIVDAFAATEDAQRAARPSHLLNYFGFSYGTFLGQTFASMFPERVGKMVLDGVVDPEDYVISLTRNTANHLDGTIAAFFIYCHEVGPSGCSYYTGSSAKDISDRFQWSLAQLDVEKARQHENWEIDLALLFLKRTLFSMVYAPSRNFDELAGILSVFDRAILNQDLNQWNQYAWERLGAPYPSESDTIDTTFRSGVLCSDQNNRWYNKTLQDIMPLVDELERQSIVGSYWASNVLLCSGWSIKAAETFTGPFTGDTATPILFVGNTYDPVTPYDNALNSATKYKDSRALIIDALGTQNLCAFSQVRKYFQTDEMPEHESLCLFDGRPFGGIISFNGTLKEHIFQLGLSDHLS